MHKTVFTMIWGCSAVLGAVIVIRARQLAVHFLVRFAEFRARRLGAKAPAAEPVRDLRVKVVMWALRYLGWLLFTVSGVVLFVVWLTS